MISLKEAAEWRQLEKWQKVFPDLDGSILRLLLSDLSDAEIRLVLNPALPEGVKTSRFFDVFFKPPCSPEEEKIQLLADIVVGLLFPKERIDLIIAKALPEIEEVYSIVLKDGGGWSSNANKSTPKKRKEAVLAWYQGNKSRLVYLNEQNLGNPILYNPVETQEKRDFYVRLLLEIIRDFAHKELTFRETVYHFKRFRKLRSKPKDI